MTSSLFRVISFAGLQKKAQVTIFIILGILILAVIFSLLVFISSRSLPDADTDKTAQQTAPAALAAQTCIRSAVMDATSVLALQGGILFRDQDGLTDRAETSSYVIFDDGATVRSVAKGITRNPRLDDPPDYPVNDEDAFIAESVYADIWGRVTLPPLDLTSFSLKNQLRSSIESRMQRCYDLEGNTFDWGTPVLSLQINNDDIIVQLENTTVVDSSLLAVRVDSSFRRLYEITRMIVNLDSRSLAFEKSGTALQQLRGCFADKPFCLYEGVSASVVRDIDSIEGYDLLTVSDVNTLVNGTPLRFSVALENRRPVVNYRGAGSIPSQFGAIGDAFIPLGETWHFNPLVYDADEDALQVSYAGWGQDTMTQFNEQLCCSRGVCALGDPICYTDVGAPTVPLESSPDYAGTEQCSAGICASLAVEPSMRGLHIMRATALDGHSLSPDFKDYTLVVGSRFDIPGDLNDLAILTSSEMDICDTIGDIQYYDALSSSGYSSPLDYSPCPNSRYLSTSDQDTYDTPFIDGSAYIRVCDVTLNSGNIDLAQDLAYALDGTNDLSTGDTISACFWSRQTPNALNLNTREFYFDEGEKGSPFGDRYALSNIASFTHSPGGALSCADFNSLSNDRRWYSVAGEPIPDGVSPGTYCRYDPGAISCSCWECDSGQCTFKISYE